MMKLYLNPEKYIWPDIIQRPVMDTAALHDTVRSILEDVRLRGDEALKFYAEKFDGLQLETLAVSASEQEYAAAILPETLKTAIRIAAENIRRFHQTQVKPEEKAETMPGVICWRKSVGIQKIGIYIPGGTAPLFSTVLMLAVPAQLAGCKQVVLCTPPQKDGSIHPAILFAAKITGITTIVKAGGAQAIAAMAYGTQSVPQVYKIFGPGNQYVTAAKQLIQLQGVAIDMPAGPSEVCVLADETAVPAFVAADLLSQAEHGPDSQVLLVASSEQIVNNINTEIDRQLALLPRQAFAAEALKHSRAVVFNDMAAAVEMVNAYAAEHLIISTSNPAAIAANITDAGSIFLGNYSPESVGDYASGTNHTLPTNGFARMYSGVSVDSFVKKITVQELTPAGLQNIGATVMAMAEAEGLQAHAAAVQVRLNTL